MVKALTLGLMEMETNTSGHGKTTIEMDKALTLGSWRQIRRGMERQQNKWSWSRG